MLSVAQRARLVAAWIAGAYLAWMYVEMGWVKFDPEGFWTPAFERWGYPTWLRLLVGFIETAGGVMLVIPWLASYGATGLALVMIGAWITRLNDGRLVDVGWLTIYLTVLAWIAFEWWGWRRPLLLLGLRRGARAA